MANVFDIGAPYTQIGLGLLSGLLRGETSGTIDALSRAITGALLTKRGMKYQFLSDLFEGMLTGDPIRYAEMIQLPSFQKIARKMGVTQEDLKRFMELAEHIRRLHERMLGLTESQQAQQQVANLAQLLPRAWSPEVTRTPAERLLGRTYIEEKPRVRLPIPRTGGLGLSVVPDIVSALFSGRRRRGQDLDLLGMMFGGRHTIQQPTRFEFRAQQPEPMTADRLLLAALATVISPQLAYDVLRAFGGTEEGEMEYGAI